MRINIFKRGTKQLNSALETWVVEWTSRYGSYNGETRQRYQSFTDKIEAEEFADSVRRAHKLIGNTGYETEVTVRKQKSGL